MWTNKVVSILNYLAPGSLQRPGKTNVLSVADEKHNSRQELPSNNSKSQANTKSEFRKLFAMLWLTGNAVFTANATVEAVE